MYPLELASNTAMKNHQEILLHNLHNAGSMLPLYYLWRIIKDTVISEKMESLSQQFCSKLPFFSIRFISISFSTLLGSFSHSCMRTKGSRPFKLSLCQGFGRARRSETEPCVSPRIVSPNKRWPNTRLKIAWIHSAERRGSLHSYKDRTRLRDHSSIILTSELPENPRETFRRIKALLPTKCVNTEL